MSTTLSASTIDFECTNPGHRRLRIAGTAGGLTTFDGRVAYCDTPDADDEHEWSPTGGMDALTLRRWRRSRELVDDLLALPAER